MDWKYRIWNRGALESSECGKNAISVLGDENWPDQTRVEVDMVDHVEVNFSVVNVE